MEALRLEGVSKRFGRRVVLQGVDALVRAGEVAVVLGPNGSGKTTLLRIVAGLLDPDSGRVWVGGRLVYGDGVRVPPEERGVGYVPQGIMLFPHLTVYENIGFGLRARGLPESVVEERVRWAAELVGVEGLLDRYPRELSGGQRQRVAIARALAVKPRLLLLDEPLSHVDPWDRPRLRRAVLEAVREAGSAALMTSHDMEDAREADRVYALVGGRLREYPGRPQP